METAPGEQSANFQALDRSIRSGDCVAFIGSGPSHCYPNWPALIAKLCAKCAVDPPGKDELSDEKALMKAASKCRERNALFYCQVLFDEFGAPDPDVPDVHLLLARMPFQSYVTTAFDPLMAKALQFVGKTPLIYRPPSFPIQALPIRTNQERAVCYIHGKVERDRPPEPEELILGTEDFAREYDDDNATLRSFLVQLFEYQACCFVGCGFREPALQKIFKICRKIRERFLKRDSGIERQRLYALSPFYWRTPGADSALANVGQSQPKRDFERERDEDQRFGEMGITVVRYEAKDEKHSGLKQFPSQFADLPTPQSRTLPPEGPS